MDGIGGKAYSILGRLAHFYHAEEAGPLLLQLADLFGRRLEATEADEYAVQRSHYVETADNQGFQGYTAPPAKRGDLDKIFALYLGALGGTSSLVKISPLVTARSLNARRLADRLVQHDPLVSWLKEKFARELSSAYASGDQDAQQAIAALITDLQIRRNLENAGQDGWLIVQDQFERLLERYRAAGALVTEDAIAPGFALQLLLGQPPVAIYIRNRLSAPTRDLLGAYNGGDSMDPRLRAALAGDLNTIILRDPGLFRRNQSDFPLDRLPDQAAALVRSIYLDGLRAQYAKEENPARRQQLLDSLDSVEPAESPVGDDQVRLNRMLLATAFPGYFAFPDIPGLNQVRTTLVQAFNRLLTVPDLFQPALFPDLVEDYPALQRRYANDPVWLNRSLLEAAFPNDLEKSYTPYRERLRGLIQVLRNGASTRQGILDIVAANLGIVGDDPQARSAKTQISIEEYNAERTSFFDGNVRLFQEFSVTNTNPEATTPEIWLTVLNVPFGLANIRFVDVASGKTVRTSTAVKTGDNLVISGNSVLLNTVPAPQGPAGEIPQIHSGVSRWRFEADLVAEGDIRPAARFDENAFDVSAFAPDSPVGRVTVLSYAYTPGVFTVVIPWHIPGFTDKFEETPDHPRNQILDLVNRVRAAGVRAHVDYKQRFTEDQDHTTRLGMSVAGNLLSEVQDTSDGLRASNTETTRENQDVSDALLLGTQFDKTYFDSLNTFAG